MVRGSYFRCRMLLPIVVLLAPPRSMDAAYYIVNPEDINALNLTYAMEIVGPGDTIELQDGIYEENLKTVSGGEEGNPIRIFGGRGAVINPDTGSNHRAIEIFHSHIHLLGFSVDGFHGPDETLESYIDKCVWIDGEGEESIISPIIKGFMMKDMFIHNCGSECVRLKNNVTGAIIHRNVIETCGVWDYQFDQGGTNGEGIYIGTSSNQWVYGEDGCSANHVIENTIQTNGNECVDIKEGSSDNMIELNYCSNQLDENSGCFNSRGDANTFRLNNASDCLGAGVRLGGYLANGHQYGQSNSVYQNTFVRPEVSGIRVETENQGLICGNTCRDGECDVIGEDLETIGSVAFEECDSDELDAAIAA